jgi:rhodanese-related sulfurtransferase
MNGLFAQSTPNVAGYRDITPEQVAAGKAGARLIDVREPHEFRGELGHIPGAELVPLATVSQASERWSKEEELVLVCRSGARSGRAAAELARLGFCRVMNMVGGMLAYSHPTER